MSTFCELQDYTYLCADFINNRVDWQGGSSLFYLAQMQGLETVENAVNAILEEHFEDVFVVEIALAKGPRNVLSIWIDTDEGINIDRCARVTRKLNAWFEENDPFDFPFLMEVSSPGVGKPLKILRQYHKNIGRKLKVITTKGEVFLGKLEAVDENSIQLLPEEKKKSKKVAQSETILISLGFDVIREAKVEISFD